MRRVAFNKGKYWGSTYPALNVRFLSEMPGRRPVDRPAIFDSGSPVSLLPDDLAEQLGLVVFPYPKDEWISTAFGMVTNGCRVILELDGRVTEPVEFGCLPKDARYEFHDYQRHPEHRGQDLYALIGLDIFARIILTFDHFAGEAFSGRRERRPTIAARKMLALFSRVAPRI